MQLAVCITESDVFLNQSAVVALKFMNHLSVQDLLFFMPVTFGLKRLNAPFIQKQIVIGLLT
jgi:hypothetical protein